MVAILQAAHARPVRLRFLGGADIGTSTFSFSSSMGKMESVVDNLRIFLSF
jgi:hypothetical protein